MSIKTAISNAGVSQAQVARDMRVNPSAVSGWVAGRFMPTAKKLYELSERLGCTVDDLLKEDGGEKV